MTNISLSHASWLRPFNAYFRQRGIDLTPYYDAANIKPEIAVSEDGWLTKQQLYSFLNRVAEGERMPELGFAVGETMTPDSIEGLGAELAKADTLHEAIHRFCQLINRHVENNRAWLEDGPDGTVWLLNETLNPFVADRRIADHAGLMTLINVVRLVAGKDWYPDTVRFQTEETTSIQRVPGLKYVSAEFNNATTGFTFPSTWLYRPLKGRAQSPAKDIDDLLLRAGESLSSKLKRLLPPLVGTGGMTPSLELLSHLCGINPRTMQRRLREENTTFAILLEETRMKKAKALLLRSDLAIKEIAWASGYSGSNNFSRAFKKHSGIAPGVYREQHQNG